MEEKRTVLRREYLKKLNGWRDRTDVAKVITGMRRCGKSTLMMQFIQMLKDSGVPDSRILYLNLESQIAEDIGDFRDLNAYIRGNMAEGRTYVFLDEVQMVNGWERTLNSLMVDYDADIYITGSNAYLLSSELATYISGRYVEIHMLPLSFQEYTELHPVDAEHNLESRFSDYIWFGSIPMAYPDDSIRSRDLLRGIYSTIIRKDVSTRVNVGDVRQLDEITMFLFSNIGNITSSSSIAKYTSMSPTTVKKYIQALEEAYIVYKAYRYDIRGKKHLKTLEKYYVADTGVRNAVLGNAKGTDISRQIENLVYLELVRRGYDVSVGSYNDREIDFTATGYDGMQYVQVAQSVLDESVFEREIRSLRDIRDSYPKLVLTMDRVFSKAPGGIRVMNLIDWLLAIDGSRQDVM